MSTAEPVSGASWVANVTNAPPALVANTSASSDRQIRTGIGGPSPATGAAGSHRRSRSS